MKSKFKSKEFVLTSYISSIIIVCLYQLVKIILLFNEQAEEFDSIEFGGELEWGYLAIFLVVCLIIYELLMFAWSLILLNEIEKKDRSNITFYLLLFTSSIPVLLLIRLYFQTQIN